METPAVVFGSYPCAHCFMPHSQHLEPTYRCLFVPGCYWKFAELDAYPLDVLTMFEQELYIRIYVSTRWEPAPKELCDYYDAVRGIIRNVRMQTYGDS